MFYSERGAGSALTFGKKGSSASQLLRFEDLSCVCWFIDEQRHLLVRVLISQSSVVLDKPRLTNNIEQSKGRTALDILLWTAYS